MAPMRRFDVVVVGGGPGGYTAAIRAAQSGLQTALVERCEVGGTCLNRGCIPTKALLHAARVYELAQRLETFGVHANGIHLDYECMAQWRDNVVSRLRRGLEHVIKSNGVEIIRGNAHFADAHSLRIVADGEENIIEFNYAVIATGSHPRSLPNLPTDTTRILVAEQALFLDAIPKCAAVIGAGAVGVELTWWLSALGTQVTLLEWMPQILPGMDAMLARALQRHFRRRGVEVITNARVAGAKISNGNIMLQWTVEQPGANGEPKPQQRSEIFDIIIIAVGRAANTASLNAGELGIELGDHGEVHVNVSLQTTIPHIYAVGDVIRGAGLAHHAMAEAELVVEALHGAQVDATSLVVPACIYTHPEVATVGLTEEQMRSETDAVLVGEFPLRASGRAVTCDEAEGSVKVVGDKRTGKLCGVHIYALHASELISEAALAIAHGLTVDQYVKQVRPHPTISEALGEAAWVALDKPLHIPRVEHKRLRKQK